MQSRSRGRPSSCHPRCTAATPPSSHTTIFASQSSLFCASGTWLTRSAVITITCFYTSHSHLVAIWISRQLYTVKPCPAIPPRSLTYPGQPDRCPFSTTSSLPYSKGKASATAIYRLRTSALSLVTRAVTLHRQAQISTSAPKSCPASHWTDTRYVKHLNGPLIAGVVHCASLTTSEVLQLRQHRPDQMVDFLRNSLRPCILTNPRARYLLIEHDTKLCTVPWHISHTSDSSRLKATLNPLVCPVTASTRLAQSRCWLIRARHRRKPRQR